jgi:hypothetical protein
MLSKFLLCILLITLCIFTPFLYSQSLVIYDSFKLNQQHIHRDAWLCEQCKNDLFTTHVVELEPRCKIVTLRSKMGALWYTLYQNQPLLLAGQKIFHLYYIFPYYTIAMFFVSFLVLYGWTVWNRKIKKRQHYISIL